MEPIGALGSCLIMSPLFSPGFHGSHGDLMSFCVTGYSGRGEMLDSAQHPHGMEPTRDFALKRGCVRKSESVPITELNAC